MNKNPTWDFKIWFFEALSECGSEAVFENRWPTPKRITVVWLKI